jgi:hypothetical protein
MTGKEKFPNDRVAAMSFEHGRTLETLRSAARVLRAIEFSATQGINDEYRMLDALYEIRDMARQNAAWCEQMEARRIMTRLSCWLYIRYIRFLRWKFHRFHHDGGYMRTMQREVAKGKGWAA